MTRHGVSRLHTTLRRSLQSTPTRTNCTEVSVTQLVGLGNDAHSHMSATPGELTVEDPRAARERELKAAQQAKLRKL